MQPSPYVYPDDELIAFLLKRFRECNAFTAEEIEWLESILARRDGQPGTAQLEALISFILQMDNAEHTTNEKWVTYANRQKAKNLLWAAQATAYKQRHVLIGVPQRKKHPRYDIPNATNVRAWQELRISLTTCYGLGFAEARTHLVQQALSDPSVTHVMFLDDDILMPQDAVPKMAYSNYPIISGVYLKKNNQQESTSTQVVEDSKYIYTQKQLPPDRNGKPMPASLTGAGLLMVEVDVFKKLPQPWFQFVMGPDGKVMIGEDAYFLHAAARSGIPTYCDPSIVGVHVDFRDGEMFGPEWLVDPVTKKMRPEAYQQYTSFPPELDITELAAADVVDVFGRNKDQTERVARK